MAERIEQPCAEGVAAAEAIDDVADFVWRVMAVGIERSEERLLCLAVIKHSTPVIMVGGNAFAKRNADMFDLREFLKQLGGDFLVSIDVEFA